MLDLLVGDTGIYLRSLDIRVTEHLTHAFHRYTLAERHRRKGVAGKVKGQAFLYSAYLTDVHTS